MYQEGRGDHKTTSTSTCAKRYKDEQHTPQHWSEDSKLWNLGAKELVYLLFLRAHLPA